MCCVSFRDQAHIREVVVGHLVVIMVNEQVPPGFSVWQPSPLATPYRPQDCLGKRGVQPLLGDGVDADYCSRPVQGFIKGSFEERTARSGNLSLPGCLILATHRTNVSQAAWSQRRHEQPLLGRALAISKTAQLALGGSSPPWGRAAFCFGTVLIPCLADRGPQYAHDGAWWPFRLGKQLIRER